jgi:hypothetical protein
MAFRDAIEEGYVPVKALVRLNVIVPLYHLFSLQLEMFKLS